MMGKQPCDEPVNYENAQSLDHVDQNFSDHLISSETANQLPHVSDYQLEAQQAKVYAMVKNH